MPRWIEIFYDNISPALGWKPFSSLRTARVRVPVMDFGNMRMIMSHRIVAMQV